MAGKVRVFLDWFWNEDFWLPPNDTWKSMADTSQGIYRARYEDLYYPLIVAWLLLVIRFFFENKVFKPFALYMGLKLEKRLPPTSNPILETAYKTNKQPNSQRLIALANDTELSVREIETWFRRRRLVGKPTKLKKFCETGWRALFYSSIVIFSWIVLWNKPWFWESRSCWHRYPDQSIPSDIWLYYMLELSFYWSLLISQAFDVKRSDFWEMFLHHLATIALLNLSWICNLFRIGSLIMWVHDIADVFLENAKLCLYLKYAKVADAIFYVFAVVWVITRLGYYPTWMIYSITVEAPQMVEYFNGYIVFCGLLSILLVLNLFWFYYLAKIGYVAYHKETYQVEKDSRSDASEEEEDEEE